MTADDYLDWSREGGVVRLTLNRDDVRNALSAPLVARLTEAFARVTADESVRAVVLTGAGRAFSACADLDALAETVGYSLERNREDSWANNALFQAVSECPCPVIARVNGHAIGGGAALVACADIAVSVSDARFGFAEVRVGIAPAVISSYVVPKIGLSAARWLFLTGEQVSADRAREIGLVHAVSDGDGLDDLVSQFVTNIERARPGAQRVIKHLLTSTWPNTTREEYVAAAVEAAARVRVSPEARASIAALVAGSRERGADPGTGAPNARR